MPVASIGGNTVGQSNAINFFIASEVGLMGSSTFEAAQILAIQEHIKEMRTKFYEVIPYGQTPNEEKLTEWFEGGATDVTGSADRAGYANRYAKWWFGRIEAVLGNNGFAVGNQISLADVIIFAVFADYLRDHEVKGDVPQFKREPFYSKAKTDALLASFPKLRASIDAVANNANAQRWLEARGPQGF
jgi:glutathione S-transferase